MNHPVAQTGTLATRPEIRVVLRRSGLRPTRQRLALAELLFARGNRHISAEGLHDEATIGRVPVSLATIYNTLHQFTEAGLLREVAVDGSKTYFDTNTGDHHHFFVEDDNEVIDIPDGEMGLGRLPAPPPGYEISRIDVVVRLRRIRQD
jgi:Fur family iron response transcriptional regulator